MKGARQACRQLLGYQLPDVYLYPYHNLTGIKHHLNESYILACCRHKLNPDFKIYFDKAVCTKVKEKTLYDILIETAIPQKKADFHFNGRFVEKSFTKYWVTDENKTTSNFTRIRYSDLDSITSAGVIVFDKTQEKFKIPICQEVYFVECDLFSNSNLNEFAPIVEDKCISDIIDLKIKSNIEEYFFPKNLLAIENRKIHLVYNQYEFEVDENSLLSPLEYQVDVKDLSETTYLNATKALGYWRMGLNPKTDFENTLPQIFPLVDFALEFLILYYPDLHINQNFGEYFVQNQNYIFKSEGQTLARLTLNSKSSDYQEVSNIIVKLEDSSDIRALRRMRKRPLIKPDLEYSTKKIPFDNVFKETLTFSDFTINYLVK